MILQQLSCCRSSITLSGIQYVIYQPLINLFSGNRICLPEHHDPTCKLTHAYNTGLIYTVTNTRNHMRPTRNHSINCRPHYKYEYLPSE